MALLKNIVIFAAGAEAFHTFAHVFFTYAMKFPIETNFFPFTSTMNTTAIVVNALITAGLLYWASRMKR